MTAKTKTFDRLLSVILCIALIMTCLPSSIFIKTASAATKYNAIADIGTADTWENMMGTHLDGNRYAGRVWADKSVYTDGQTAKLNSSGTADSTYNVSLEDDEAFQIIFSVLGSSMTTKTTSSTLGPMDVVIVLDNSNSMKDISNGTTRLQKVVESANRLLENLLTASDIRIGITSYNYNSETILPFGEYKNGVKLSVNDYINSGVISAYDNSSKLLGKDGGYQSGTNTQSGYDRAMRMLATASNTEGRAPIAIVLTDGAANTSVDKSFYDISKGTIRQRFYDGGVPVGVALSTLLNAAFMKATVEDHYGIKPVIYGIGVDLESGDGSDAIINPGSDKGFSSQNSNANIREAYSLYTNTWAKGNKVTVRHSSYSFEFDHNYPSGSSVTDEDIKNNINYVDNYYNVTSDKLDDTFTQIYEELSSGVFNPISSSTIVDGATGVDNTPLVYVDNIGKYMEIKDIQAVTLFGSSYNVTNNGDGTYTVATGTGLNPTTNESWNTAEDIKISVSQNVDGSQKLEIEINQEILPIILEQVEANTIGSVTDATITELSYNPLRVYYTVGLSSDILLANGDVDVSKIDSGYKYINNTTGEISFYSNSFDNAKVNHSPDAIFDAHIGFQPSAQNRYYYHQSNQAIFSEVTAKTGKINWEKDEYGVVYDKDAYNLTWLTYDKYKTLQSDDTVYTYVTYYHPTPNATDAASAAEEVTYIIYADWGYLKESVSFYDNTAKTYVNYDAVKGYVTGNIGYAVPIDKVSDVIDAYKNANPNADIYGVLGMGSLRTSRLHNMEVAKTSNAPVTDALRYQPEYTHDTALDHHGNSVVVWLGNNGRLTTAVDTGIALKKEVTQAIGNIDDTYALTVTVPSGVTAAPVVKDHLGNDVTAAISSYSNNILTVNVKSGETVYISGIPGGTQCAIGETIPSGAEYYIESKTDTVTVPTLSEALSGAGQFALATVTNSPNKYGNLTVIKDINHDLFIAPDAMYLKEFTFEVTLPVTLAGKTFAVDKTNASLFTGDRVIVDNNGKFTVTLKDNESITIIGLPENTPYTVSETAAVAGYTNTTGVITGNIIANTDNDAHFINAYTTTPVVPSVTITGQKILNDVHGTYTADENFEFVLSKYVGATNLNPSGYEEMATATAKAGGTYSFNLTDYIPSFDLGVYYFRVTEKEGTTDGMSYDATRGLFSVNVTDTNADGTLEYVVEDFANTIITSAASGYTVKKDFTNIYDVETTHVDINITKLLDNETGVDIPKDIFHFELKQNGSLVNTYTTDASGHATVRISNLGEGNYTYELSERNEGMAGMSYDNTTYTINISVTKNGTQLVAVANIGADTSNTDNTVDVIFKNTYTLVSVPFTLSGTKLLNGRNIDNNEFEFALYETGSDFELGLNPVAKETTKNVGNTFAFNQIQYTRTGQYYYSVKELNGGKDYFTYDTTHYHITVTVDVDSNDKTRLAVTDVKINKIGTNSDTSGGIVFVNDYVLTPATYALGGIKILSGRAISTGEFEFALFDNSGSAIGQPVANKADGTFSFDAITYTAVGEYKYTIKEVIPAGTDANGKNDANGITYDLNEYTVTVTVTDNKDGTLNVSADKPNTQIKFENHYHAKSAVVSFNGTKDLVGKTLNNNEFTFKLYKTDHNFNIEGLTPVDTQKNVDGKFSFGDILFDTTGSYFYSIVEDASVDTKSDIVYDGTQYNFHVTVSDAGDGQLKVSVTNLNTATTTVPDKKAEVTVGFTNATTDEVTKKEVYYANSSTEIDGNKVKAGDFLTYFITYTNFTGKPVVVDIMDTIPDYTTYVDNSASHNGSYAGEHVNWILNVAANESITVYFDVKVDEPEAVVANTAVVRDGINTYTTNEVVNHTVENYTEKEVFYAADPTVMIDGKNVNIGEQLLYTISYTNASPDKVNITVTDNVPNYTTYVEGSADNNGTYKDGTVTWDITGVDPWSTVIVSFKVTVNDAKGTITNKAVVVEDKNTYTTNEVKTPITETPDTPDDTDKPNNPDTPDNSTTPNTPNDTDKPDTPDKTDKPETPETPEDSGTPNTGDNMNLQLWFVLLLISGGALVGVTVYGTRYKKSEEN